MEKVKVALIAVIESLVYMSVALLSAFCAMALNDFVPWWACMLVCLFVALYMSRVIYMERIYGSAQCFEKFFGVGNEDDDPEEAE